jgi:hypothetical protein
MIKNVPAFITGLLFIPLSVALALPGTFLFLLFAAVALFIGACLIESSLKEKHLTSLSPRDKKDFENR